MDMEVKYIFEHVMFLSKGRCDDQRSRAFSAVPSTPGPLSAVGYIRVCALPSL